MLKEAGFDGMAHKYYYRPRLSGKMEERFAISPRNLNKEPRCISLPTQQLAVRWLREVHNIHVSGELMDDLGRNKEPGWFYTIDRVSPYEQYDPVGECDSYQSYEASLEAGIQDALGKIIKNKEDERVKTISRMDIVGIHVVDFSNTTVIMDFP